MKKLVIIFSFILLVSLGLLAKPTISLEGERSGNQYMIHLNLVDEVESYDLTAMEFVVSWMPSVVLDTILLSDRLPNHNVAFCEIDEISYQVYLYSIDNDIISGKNGRLLTLVFDTRGVDIGCSVVSVNECLASDEQGTGYTLEPCEYFISDDTISGDVTGDGQVDIADVNAVINIMLGKAQASDFPGDSDVNDDGMVDVSDVNIIINLMLGK